jgi:hypothetical protein
LYYGPVHFGAYEYLRMASMIISFIVLGNLQVWFKNRRAKWRKQKREEQERMRKIQEEDVCRATVEQQRLLQPQNFSDEDSSDLEVA